jgi:hypothetical protein
MVRQQEACRSLSGLVYRPGGGAGLEVALYKTSEDQRDENKGNHHNPRRKRGIFRTTRKKLQLDPSLTFRVVMAADSQLRKAPASTKAGASGWAVNNEVCSLAL